MKKEKISALLSKSFYLGDAPSFSSWVIRRLVLCLCSIILGFGLCYISNIDREMYLFSSLVCSSIVCGAIYMMLFVRIGPVPGEHVSSGDLGMSSDCGDGGGDGGD